MNDSAIRSRIKKQLIDRLEAESDLVIEEVGLRHGVARIDLMVVNGLLHGYEVKSDKDTLRRLPGQVRVYSSVLDKVTLVVGYRHAGEAIRIIPAWWGVKLAEMGTRGAVRLSEARPARRNQSVDKLSLAKLLWREEALALLTKLNRAEGVRSKPRSFIYSRLAEVAPLDLLRTAVCDALRRRSAMRPGELRPSGDD